MPKGSVEGMNKVTIEGDLIEVSLRQLGATNIEDIGSMMYLVEFKLTQELTLSYVYNITRKAKFYLQRIKPYPVFRIRFSDEYEIVEFITKDVRRFRNAINSSNFKNFIQVAGKVSTVTNQIEELFLNYNVDKDVLDGFDERLEQLIGDMDAVRAVAERVSE